ncbi:MAG: PilW family protein [Vibrio hibernica]
MAIRSAISLMKYQKGVSLVEMLIASTIGILAIIAVGSIFISGQKLATDRSMRLLVLQNMNDAMRYMKEDMQRAGYNGNNGSSLILSGASDVITVTSSSIAYAYLSNNNKIVYTKFTGEPLVSSAPPVGGILQMCIEPDVSAANPTVPTCARNYSLMDDSRVVLNEISFAEIALGNSVSSAYITITMKAALANAPNMNDNYEQTMTTKIKQRNWK